ncbi:MAG: OsmC family protein [Chloroflexi bacterium]|nr:OsmC family protein [Chloroflexota bacterium]
MEEAKVTLLDAMQFRGVGPSGQTLVMDAAEDVGGQGKGPRPLELLLLALGGCTGMDVISILRKMRLDVKGYEIGLQAERAPEHPRVYTSINVEHVIRGRGITPEAVERAIELSDTKYCSVGAMMRKAVPITTSYRIIEE